MTSEKQSLFIKKGGKEIKIKISSSLCRAALTAPVTEIISSGQKYINIHIPTQRWGRHQRSNTADDEDEQLQGVYPPLFLNFVLYSLGFFFFLILFFFVGDRNKPSKSPMVIEL